MYNNDPNAPKPNIPLTPGACAVIIDEKKRIFLHKRADNDLWALPGGVMNLGESISDCCLREIKEEINLDVEIKNMIGIYSSPKCVFDFGDGKIFQSFVVSFFCKVISGREKINNESSEYGWFSEDDIQSLDTLPFVKDIIRDALTKKDASFD